MLEPKRDIQPEIAIVAAGLTAENPFMRSSAYRHTKIIFTIGPASLEPEVLSDLLARGVDVCRLNMAHASHEWTREAIGNLQKACVKAGRKVALMMDVKGPEIRTGPLESPINLERDEPFDFFLDQEAEPVLEGLRGIRINYAKLDADVKPGDTILVDSGLMRLRVDEVLPDRIRCNVRIGGELGSRRHINVPGVHVKLPSLTAKDRADIELGIQMGVDFFALSFVRSADDLDILRRFIEERGSRAQIIAKIEDQSAISSLDEIIQASDGLMVARGDLGIEIPYETLPIVQRRAVRACQGMGKPVIVATHMLESMIQNPMPTRAEITDIANAVHEQADCIMLSGETTVGRYPAECVEVMNRIIRSTEGHADRKLNDKLVLKTARALMLRSAIMLSDELPDCGITVFTRSGFLARVLSALRPRKSPIYAFTDVPETFQNLLIYWGVEPFQLEFREDPEETIQNAFACLKEKGWVGPESSMVVISNALAGKQVIDSIQYRQVH